MYIMTSIVDEVPSVDNSGILLSVIAILISIISLVLESYTNKKNKMLDVEAEIIKTVYDKYLITNIPNARREIKHTGEKVISTDNFIQVLNDLRLDSLFYEYKDINFYNFIKNETQKLENYVIDNEIMDNSSYLKYEKKIAASIEAIYNEIINKQLGKRNYKLRLVNFFKENYIVIFLIIIIIILLVYISTLFM